jgi:hypothetical protein
MRALLVVVLLAESAFANTPVQRPEAIEVDRDTTPPGQAEMGFESGAPIGDYAFGLTVTEIERPLRIHTLELLSYPVKRRETATLGGAIALGDDVIVDAKFAMSHQVGRRYQNLGDDRPLDPWVPNDAQLGARVHVMTRGALAVFVRANITIPTGDDHDFAGDASWSAAWSGIARITLPHDLTLAATGGIRIRGAEVQVADRLIGDELFWAAGATVGIPPFCSLWCSAEQFKVEAEVVGVVSDRVAHLRGPSPIEGRVGVVGRLRPHYTIAARVGTQLDDQLGAPELRATIDLVY